MKSNITLDIILIVDIQRFSPHILQSCLQNTKTYTTVCTRWVTVPTTSELNLLSIMSLKSNHIVEDTLGMTSISSTVMFDVKSWPQHQHRLPCTEMICKKQQAAPWWLSLLALSHRQFNFMKVNYYFIQVLFYSSCTRELFDYSWHCTCESDWCWGNSEAKKKTVLATRHGTTQLT